MNQSDLIAHAKKLVAEKRYEESVKVCKQCLIHEPLNKEVRTCLGMGLLRLQRYEEARNHMKELVRNGLADSLVMRVLGECQMRMGEINSSIKTFQRALEMTPDDSELHQLLNEAEHIKSTKEPPPWNTSSEQTNEDSFSEFHPESTRIDPPLMNSDEISIHTVHEDLSRQTTPTTEPTFNDASHETDETIVRVQTSDTSHTSRLPSETYSEDDITIARDLDDSATTARPIYDAKKEILPEIILTNRKDHSEPLQSPPRAKGALNDPQWLKPIHKSSHFRDFRQKIVHKLSQLPRLPWRGSLAWSFVSLGLVFVISTVSALIAVRAFLTDRAFDRIMHTVEIATDNGLQSSLNHAIHLIKRSDYSNDRFKALHARLLAISQLEHGEDHSLAIQKLLSSLSSSGRSLVDARIAYAYVYLQRGEIVTARSIISATTTTSQNEQAAEAARARSLTAQAWGDFTRAELDARAAAVQRHDSPRHIALASIFRAHNGDPKGALADLKRSPDAKRSPVSRLAQAIIFLEQGQDLIKAGNEAEEILQALGSISSLPQKSWAYLIKAEIALRTGRLRLARKYAQTAAPHGPMWQDDFGMTLCEILVRAGADNFAEKIYHALPAISTDPQRRTQLQAEIALALKNPSQAQHALQIAGDTPRTLFLRGRLHELRGELREASRLFEKVKTDPELNAEAFQGLARIELNEGHPRASIDYLKEALLRSPGDLELIVQLAHSQLRAKLIPDAIHTLNEGISYFPSEPELRSLQAWIELAQGNTSGALSNAQAALAHDPQDIGLTLDLGQIAQATGNCSIARQAYHSILSHFSRHQDALIGLAQTEVRCGNVEGAQNLINQLEPLVAQNHQNDAIRAELFLLTGAGHVGAEMLEKVLNKDASLWAIEGNLWFQAEEYTKAQQAYKHALELNTTLPQANIGLAWLHIQQGRLAQARKDLQEAEDVIAENSSAWMKATVLATQSRIEFESGNFTQAASWAKQAIEVDSSSSMAHHVLALLAQQHGEDPIPQLRLAARGAQPLPEVFALLASLLQQSTESCQLTKRYLSAAPRGFDASRMKKLAQKCAAN